MRTLWLAFLCVLAGCLSASAQEGGRIQVVIGRPGDKAVPIALPKPRGGAGSTGSGSGKGFHSSLGTDPPGVTFLNDSFH